MADKSKNLNPQKGRLNLLVMRSKGQVTNLSLSPFTLIFALLFAIIFIAASVVVMNRYYVLYYDHKELAAAHQITAREFLRLRSLYSYQSSVASEYAKIMDAMNRADPQSGLDISVPAIGELPPAEDQRAENENNGDQPSVNSLDDWATLFPDPASPPEQTLDINGLQISGRNFRFQLTAETSGGVRVQGRMLLLFAVEDGEGRLVFRPVPKFEVNSKDPDFNDGPGYNIGSSKQITGRLDEMPPDGLVVEMMAVVKSSNGQVVLKKKIAPAGR